MKLQQLRFVYEIAQHQLNVSQTAESLYTSQPGISKQIKLLEEELGIQIFKRSGKHLVAVTPPGEKIIQVAENILKEVGQIKDIAEEYSSEDTGKLEILADAPMLTYALPNIIRKFKNLYPEVKLIIKETQSADHELQHGIFDLLLTTTDINTAYSSLIPCYSYPIHTVTQASNTVTELNQLKEALKNQAIAVETGIKEHMINWLAKYDIKGNIAFTSSCPETIVKHVGEFGGVGFCSLLDNMADAHVTFSNIVGDSSLKIGINRSRYLRRFSNKFIELFAPQWAPSATEYLNSWQNHNAQASWNTPRFSMSK